ncbi:diacylglycerol/lipid kinase family protein [Paludifilum halophilum]|uniref:DAGKc domain-containing protein n=1 Tax=Paludifilum halophilum TaxID=1642702 RepID=A0A235B9E5_9BACL|nr:diacylglycerol kinase family protein [Paludifilum halophilum]OYD08933.1 hypothetical protein CHM34_03910 [Paludifilum halophilum]
MRLFIVNPVAGNGRGRKVWSQVEQTLQRKQIPYHVRFTERPGHAGEIARSDASRGDLTAIVAVGGDGTVHEVGNGLVGTQVPVGFIPAGSGNDFSLAQEIPDDPGKALERVLEHRVRRVDTANIGGRTMIGFAGIGFDGRVAQTVNRFPFKHWLGRLNYVLGALQVWVGFRPIEVSLTVDGKPYDYSAVWLIAITNTPYYGGGMKICPHACHDDGQLDICCVNNLSRNEFLRIFPSVFKGKHISHPSVTLLRGKEITLSSESQLAMHVDGETIGQPPSSITVQPESLWVL